MRPLWKAGLAEQGSPRSVAADLLAAVACQFEDQALAVLGDHVEAVAHQARRRLGMKNSRFLFRGLS